VIVANLINVALNQLLIFGAGPIPAAGVTGAGLATGLTRLSLLLMLVLWVCRFQLHRGAWNGWSKAAWSRERLQETWRLGWPVGLYLGLEIWAFQFTTLLAGWLGNSSLAASTIVLNLASLSFMLPLGVAVATAARVGNLIGARQPDAAQRASWVAFGLGASAMSICAILFVALRQFLPRCYTSNVAVIELAARTLPVVAAFQLFDGVQVVGCAVLRGMGRTRPAAVMNLIGYYMLGLPLAWWLAFRRGWGLVGLWLGLAVALMVIAILLVTWVARRGPKTMRQPLFAGSE
jgi:MATE family multidrug resistance protein